jgi:hypothetical protein
MMTRALRRAGLALTRADRVNVAPPGSSTAASEVALGMHLRWPEIAGRETTAVQGRQPPRLSLIPAPVAAQVGGRRAW